MNAHRWFEESLRSLSRCAKRWLGVENAAAVNAPPPPVYLLDASAQPVFSDRCAQGTFVFLLQHASRGSGGLADILHLGVELEKTGLRVFYCPVGGGNMETMTGNILWTNSTIRRDQVTSQVPIIPEYVCATTMATAYTAIAQPSHRKLYFVQDYEPWFYSAGVARWCAVRTYELGLEMITLGPWLAEHLRAVHGNVRVLEMPFPVSDVPEVGRPLQERKCITFYVQPDKEHRGTELALETARRLSSRLRAKSVEMDLVLFGSVENEYLKPDFPCTMLGLLSEAELVSLFRKTRVGFCASFTNVSLVTFRFLSFGCLTVDLDLPNVAKNIPACAEPLVTLCAPDPGRVADAIERYLDFKPSSDIHKECARGLAERHSWSSCVRHLKPMFTQA